MRKYSLIKNPELFQGSKYLSMNKNYFEGWYFKITNGNCGIAFIPGININDVERKAFVQVITDKESFFIDYKLSEFKFNDEPFYVKIGDNFFSKDFIHIDIIDNENNLVINGNVRYSECMNIDINIFSPNIMGIFSYVPFMECNHAILSMKNKADGVIFVNDKEISFNGGVGYIEKDWGSSFPKSYVWCCANNFINSDSDVAFMLSIANIPFKIFDFTGVICSLIVDGKEYRFATYNNTKILKYDTSEGLSIILKKGKLFIFIDAVCDDGSSLYAPVLGKMSKDIIESISAVIKVVLKQNDRIIFSGTSNNCGLEIVSE